MTSRIDMESSLPESIPETNEDDGSKEGYGKRVARTTNLDIAHIVLPVASEASWGPVKRTMPT